MKHTHITHLLDEKAFADLGADELNSFRLHADECGECREALDAARLSSALLKIRAADAPVPSVFFQARVMNAVRLHRENLKKPLGVFWRWWQASGALVAVMLFTLAALVTLTAVAPTATEPQATGTRYSLYSTERVILNQRPPRELNAEQVLEVIYSPRDDFEKR